MEILIEFFKTWYRSFRALINADKCLVEDSVFKLRKNTCKACIHYSDSYNMCSVCYCNIAVKCRLTEAKCPMGFW